MATKMIYYIDNYEFSTRVFRNEYSYVILTNNKTYHRTIHEMTIRGTNLLFLKTEPSSDSLLHRTIFRRK